MELRRTYIDSGVLITAARGTAELSGPALDIISDPSREFVSSEWVRLEVMPKAIYFQRQSEVAFYQLFFDRVNFWAPFEPDVFSRALDEASKNGLSSVDAIHVVLASLTGCDELVTSEKKTSAIHRTSLITITTLYPAEAA